MINHNLTNNDNCHNKSDDDWNDDDEGDSIQRPTARGHGPTTGGQRLLEKCGGKPVHLHKNTQIGHNMCR